MSERLRIGLIGAAGTGKSTVAGLLSAKIGVPFKAAKLITQRILEREGYDYGSGIRVERFLATEQRQLEILDATLEMQSVDESFVTDRTVVDLAAYALCEIHESDKAVRSVVTRCRDNLKLYTHLFLCPWMFAEMVENRRRTMDPWYQHLIHVIDRGLIAEWGLDVTVLSAEKSEDRVVEILNRIGRPTKES